MDVVRLEPGHDEPEGEDYVKIDRLPSGGFQFTGTVASAGDLPGATFATGTTRADGPWPTEASAEEAAIAWARGEGSAKLYILPAVLDPEA